MAILQPMSLMVHRDQDGHLPAINYHISRDDVSLIQQFYDQLRQLSLTKGVPTLRSRQRPLASDSGALSSTWRTFLDNLCMLADFHRAGQGVTAIAVEDSLPLPTFWVATTQSYPGKRQECLKHIEWILDELHDLYRSQDESDDRGGDLSVVIAKTSILLGKVKVKNYRNVLRSLLKKVEDCVSTNDGTS